jgi:hypothetical protein
VHVSIASLLLTLALGTVAALWVVYGAVALAGLARLPRLGQFPPLSPVGAVPLVSVLLAARNEAAHVGLTLETLLAQTYPALEIIVVNDRSEDDTGRILQRFAERDPRLRTLTVERLPSGWLGKPYALHLASQLARGEWLIFTDADVRFAPDTVARALTLASTRELDHLTLFATLELHGFWESVALGYFSLVFLFAMRPWRVEHTRAGSYMGLGAFQLIRRRVYQQIGGHRRLALEVIDDMKLGKLVKQAGCRSGVGLADGRLRLRWYAGLRGVVEGLTKNMFAGFGYRVGKALATVGGALALSVAPFVAAVAAGGAARWLAGIAALAACTAQAVVLAGMDAVPLYGLLHPLGALVYIYIVLRSMLLTLGRGGIVWRNTYYRLEELRRGLV